MIRDEIGKELLLQGMYRAMKLKGGQTVTRISIISAVVLLFLLPPLHGVIAEEKKEEGTAEAEPVAKATEADTMAVKASKVWMSTVWKRVSELTAKERAFEVERPTTTAGVRGVPAEDEIEKRLYYKEGSQVPSRQEVRKAIDLLKESMAEALYLIGQCYAQLGENKEALAAYNRLLKEHPKSEWAKKMPEEIEGLQKKEER